MTSELCNSYAIASSEHRYRQSLIGCFVALILVPAGASLDYFVYNDFFVELMSMRVACCVGLLIVCGLHFSSWGRDNIVLLNLAWPILITGSISFMISMVDGAHGPYYAGLNLVVLGATLLMPLRFLDTIIVSTVTLCLYIVICVQTTIGGDSWHLLFSNSFFLISTGVICCISSLFAEKRRFREFELRYELDERNKELAELDRVKSDFYANISHEFRTPLTLILSPIEDMLARKDIDEQTERTMRYVRDNGHRLLKLVNDLLDVLKLEEKMQTLEKQPIYLNGLMGNLVAGMEQLANKREVHLFWHGKDERLIAEGDPSAVEKIFINLINNAIKFTGYDGRVDVSIWQEETYIVCEVADTGMGISAEDLPYIFDRFRQADSSSTRKHQGTGLGLSLVKELCTLMEGHIEVESSLGEGTKMKVFLPKYDQEIIEVTDVPIVLGDSLNSEMMRAGLTNLNTDMTVEKESTNAADETNSSAAIKSSSEESSASQSHLPTIVVVEDEPDVRSYFIDMLKDEYRVFSAVNGKAGLDLVREKKPDLVVLDLMMPELDGLQVCHYIKTDPDLNGIKIMMLTARSDENSKLRALDQGADDYLTKPFSSIEVRKRLANLYQATLLQSALKEKNIELQSTLDKLGETQGHLIQSEKLNALGRLSAGLLHEVNNPLSFAFATFQLLERDPKLSGDEELKEMLDDIREGMERISAIVKDLKAFAYPEKTAVQTPFDLSEAIDSSLRMVSTKSSNVLIENNIQQQHKVLGSKSHIVQVLINVIENAIDAIEQSGHGTKVALRSEQVEGRVKIFIRDDGPGISKENQEKVFDPFFTTKDVGAGMGMGLSICHTIIKNHGGELVTVSEEGEYTEFSFSLLDAEQQQTQPKYEELENVE